MTFSSIRAGDRVTIRTPQGQERSGTATIWNGDHQSWVLNAGGRHGTPIIASERNFVKVSRRRVGKSEAAAYAIINGGVTP